MNLTDAPFYSITDDRVSKRISQSNRGPVTVKKYFFRKHLNSILMLSTTKADRQRHRHKSFHA